MLEVGEFHKVKLKQSVGVSVPKAVVQHTPRVGDRGEGTQSEWIDINRPLLPVSLPDKGKRVTEKSQTSMKQAHWWRRARIRPQRWLGRVPDWWGGDRVCPLTADNSVRARQ
jgi:hypothetical protein